MESLTETEREIADLKAQLAARSVPRHEVDSISHTQREIDDLKAQLAAKSEAKSKSRTDSLSAAQREINELKAALAAKSASKSRTDSVTAAQREIDELKAALAAKSASKSRTDSVTAAQREIDELKAALAAKSASKSRTDSVTAAQREIDELKAALAAKSSSRSATQSQSLTESQREINALREELAKKSSTKTSSTVTDSVTSTQREIEALRAELERKSTTGASDSLTAAQREVNALKAELERKSTSTTTTGSLTAAEREINALKAELEKKSTTRTEDHKEISLLKKKLAAMDSSISKLGALDSGVPVNELQRQLQKKKGIEICFVMDCTGSMGSWIQITKQKIEEIAKFCTEIHDGSQTCVRFSFIGYRDHSDSERIVKLNQGFTESLSDLQDFLAPIRAFGGGDTPEDVAGAFKEVVSLPWVSTTRLVIHLADAPCHGLKYHSCDDSYPDGDPQGLDPEALLAQMGQLKIDYYFGRINNITDKMIQYFRDAHNGANFEVFELGSDVSKFVPGVLSSVTKSRSLSVVATAEPLGAVARSWMY
eukprot:TRINITY_DN4008_c0_g1_i2.p1 TRINITY_DN4008_c0_g1~~TRINITY_DN4008_c0_g1_i2.p1  ORF type:complete len:543 (-),score=111.67 TRINITY_DN4008_c0_g1_i2:121-1749(-)